MDKELIKILFALLRFEISEAELCETDKNLIKEEVLPTLYKLSKKHDLAHLAADALDETSLFCGDEEIKKRFLQERNMAVYRYEQLQYELDCVCDVFEKVKIPFVPLKGSIVRKYYPKPWMRTSCDIDVLIQEENLGIAIKTLEETLSYQCTAVGQHDAQIYAPNGVHIELHYSLLESGSNDAIKEVFESLWEKIEQGSSYHCKLPDPLFYCYHISHIAKHLKYGGCGVRAILDTWILNNKLSFDKKKREDLLQGANLLPLAKAVEKLSRVWFSGEEADETSETLGEYILIGGTYGSFKNKVAAQQSRKKNKISYLLSRLFLPYSQMKYQYPRLQKCPILYPFYIVKRWFLLLKKDKRNLAKRELEQTVRGDENEQKKVSKLLKDLGL